MTSDSVASCSKTAAGLTCRLKSGKEIETDKVLVSVGRRFNTDDLNLEKAGVECGSRGEIKASDAMETTAAGVYAAGDVVGKKMYAHSASREAIVAVENALGENKRMDYSAVPSCIFTNPQVGSVGLTERDAREQGVGVRVGVFHFRALGKAHVIGEISGLVKIVADSRTDVILGVHIVGPHASELIHEGVIAVSRGLTARSFSETIHAHPTLSEAVMEAAKAVNGQSIHG